LLIQICDPKVYRELSVGPDNNTFVVFKRNKQMLLRLHFR